MPGAALAELASPELILAATRVEFFAGLASLGAVACVASLLLEVGLTALAGLTPNAERIPRKVAGWLESEAEAVAIEGAANENL
jgi:hypothetical protein